MQTIQPTEARLVPTHANRLNPLSPCAWTEPQPSYECGIASVLNVKMIPERNGHTKNWVFLVEQGSRVERIPLKI